MSSLLLLFLFSSLLSSLSSQTTSFRRSVSLILFRFGENRSVSLGTRHILQCVHIAHIHQWQNQQAIRVENEKMSNDLLSRRFNAFFANGQNRYQYQKPIANGNPTPIFSLLQYNNANKNDSISTMDLFKAGSAVRSMKTIFPATGNKKSLNFPKINNEILSTKLSLGRKKSGDRFFEIWIYFF